MKSQAEAQGLAGSLAPSSTAQLGVKATSQLPFLAAKCSTAEGALTAASPAPSLAPHWEGYSREGLVSSTGQAVSSHSFHPAAAVLCLGHTHKQTTSQEGSLVAPSNPARCLGAQLTPGTPRCITAASPQQLGAVRFWLGQSLGPTEKMGSLAAKCRSQLLLPPPPGLKESLELPTGFSRNEDSSSLDCSPQHSHTQRNSQAVVPHIRWWK